MENFGSGIELTEIHGFASPAEFSRFRQFLQRAVSSNALKLVPVQRACGEMLEEEWYEEQNGTTGRLVSPEAPFRGIFLAVKNSIESM